MFLCLFQQSLAWPSTKALFTTFLQTAGVDAIATLRSDLYLKQVAKRSSLRYSGRKSQDEPSKFR
jgi:hypothetical protein